jgi:hypothetical protein
MFTFHLEKRLWKNQMDKLVNIANVKNLRRVSSLGSALPAGTWQLPEDLKGWPGRQIRSHFHSSKQRCQVGKVMTSRGGGHFS